MSAESAFSHALSAFVGFLAIMNPIANTPVFLGLTEGADSTTRREVAARALLLSFVIVSIFAGSGNLILQLFGVSLPAFRIVGGILVALVGYQMLNGGDDSPVQQPTEQDKRASLEAELEIAITPLAMPILAGPGTIATAMNFASAGTVSALATTVGAFLLLCLITYVCFVSGERFVGYLGENGIKVITRLMGLILAVTGVQMLINGIGGAARDISQMGAF